MPRGTSSSSQRTVDQIQIPIAALIAVPVAFGVILIVAIIWCYIQTVKHRDKFRMNSQPMVIPIANGSSTHATSNGMYNEMPRTINNGLVMGTPVNGNVYDSIEGPRDYQNRDNISLGNATNLNNQTNLENSFNGDTLHDTDEGCSHENHSRTPVESGDIERESPEYLEHSNVEEPQYQDHPEDSINTDSNENNILRDCEEQGSSVEINYIRNSVV